MNISKNGIITATGSPNDNLLGNTNFTFIQNTDGTSYQNFTIPDLSKLQAGITLTVSINIELYNVKTLSRIGAEPAFRDSSNTKQYIGVWTSVITNRKERISATKQLSINAIGIIQQGVYIQGATFNEGGYIKLSNPKLEIGNIATSWTPNSMDILYVGNTNGFIEIEGKSRIQQNGFIETNNYIEI